MKKAINRCASCNLIVNLFLPHKMNKWFMVRISRPVDWYFGQKFLSDIITWRQKYGFFNERFLLDETETKSLSFNTTIRVILGRRVPNLLN